MSTASNRELTHADRHDLDKLARWKSGLDSADYGGEPAFPACAIFLVTGEDRASHDIFRAFRSSFEELGAGFHHLVIFGQHGASTTQAAVLDVLGLSQASVPVLAVADAGLGGTAIFTVRLPPEETEGDLDESQAWGTVLHSIRDSASQRAGLSLGGLPGVVKGELPGGSLAAFVDEVSRSLG